MAYKTVIKENRFGTFDLAHKVPNCDGDSIHPFNYYGIVGGSRFKDDETAQSFFRTISQSNEVAEVIRWKKK